MDFSITELQKEFIEEVSRFANENLNSKEDLNGFSRKMWEKVSEFGLLGITIDEKYGGMKESYLTAALMLEELGHSCINNGFTFVINNHMWVSQNLIYLYGTEKQKEKYLRDMVLGRKIGAFALTECDSGSDACGMKTTARKAKDGYVLNGNKMFISNGSIADVFVIFCKCTDNKNEIIAFLVEKDFDGIEISENIETMGLNSCPLNEIVLRDCFVPEENLFADEEIGKMVMMEALQWERVFEFAPHVGSIRRIYESCMKYVFERKQFGENIGEYQAVSHKIANMRIKYELAYNMLCKISWMKDTGDSGFIESSVFKTFVSESYIETCKDAIQIMGAYGYTKEYGIERELRDALGSSIYSGTNEIQRNTIFQLMKYE